MSMKYFSTDEPIRVEATRSGHREALHLVNVVCCDSSGKLLGYFGDPGYQTFERSIAKPFQLMTAIGFRPELVDECSDKELSVMASSHSGEPGHLEVIRELLNRYGLAESLLICGYHPPIYIPAYWEYGRKNISMVDIHSNCSGKHTGMLLAIQKQGWSFENYDDPMHPIQLACTGTIARYVGRDPGDLELGVDGCGVVSWWLDLKSAAMAFARYGDPGFAENDLEKKVKERIFDAYHKAPWYMAGTDRFDTSFNQEMDGNWMCKAGGEAVFGACMKDEGIGIAVKVVDGNWRATSPALLYAMKTWGLVDEDQLERMSNWVETEVKNQPGLRVGSVRVVPGD